MIMRLFKSRKRLDNAEPGERLAVIGALSDEEIASSQALLAELAGSDADPEVRGAAVERLADPAALEPLLADANLGPAVARRIAELLDSESIVHWTHHPAVLRARLQLQPDAALLDCIKGLNDTELLLDALLACPREQREPLLDGFRNASLLGALERRTRDRDKTLNRHARKRLDVLKQLKTSAAEAEQRSQELLTMLEKAAPDANDQVGQRKRTVLLKTLEAGITTLIELETELAEFEESLEGLDDLRARAGALDQPAPLPAAQASTRATGTAVDPFVALTAAFVELGEGLRSNSGFEALTSRRQSLTSSWLEAADQHPPNDDQHAVFETVSHDFGRLAAAHQRLAELSVPNLDCSALSIDPNALPDANSHSAAAGLKQNLKASERQLKVLNWPDWAPVPAMITELAGSMGQTRALLEEWQALLSALKARVDTELTSLAERISAGELQAAQDCLSELRPLLRALPDAAAAGFKGDLARETARLHELKDWQTFATSPKRESLCEAMAELSEKPLAPADQAHRIKTLRSEWNELGPVSRAADHRLLERFNRLAEEAFKPCREHFAEQAGIRASNLVSREQICQQLEDYLDSTDWAHADFKAAEQIIRTARQEWRRFHPVDRTPGKPLEARFEQLQGKLHDNIKAEWDRNLQIKRDIVIQARSLLDENVEVHQAVEQAKALQQQWQVVGVTPRKPDQALWRDFRAACDAIFNARDDTRRSADEALKADHQSALALIEEFSQIVDGLDTGATASEAELRDLRNRFATLPHLPERFSRSVERQFEELRQSYRTAIEDGKRSARRRQFTDLKDMDLAVSALETRHRGGEPVNFEAPASQFGKRWDSVHDEVPLASLSRLTIETEISAELDSPAADRTARLEVQVEIMNSRRSRAILTPDAFELAERWCALGPKDDPGIDALRDRFFAALEVIDGR